MARARQPAAAPGELPPALRDPLIVIDDFLPADLALAMRRDLEAHFEAEPGAGRQIWDFAFTAGLEACLRTAPERVIAPASLAAFAERLGEWSAEALGLTHVTAPALSVHVGGCRQGLRNASGAGRFAYVYSLTRNDRTTSGGETLVHREADPFRELGLLSGAGETFFEAVAPRFNRLILFDARLPHAIEPVAGPMDPREGRLTLHGFLSEGDPMAGGALPGETLVGAALATFKAFDEAAFLEDFHGPATFGLEVAEDGTVSECRVILDRVIQTGAGERRWPRLLNDVVARFEDMRFPPADDISEMLIPISFGPTIARG